MGISLFGPGSALGCPPRRAPLSPLADREEPKEELKAKLSWPLHEKSLYVEAISHCHSFGGLVPPLSPPVSPSVISLWSPFQVLIKLARPLSPDKSIGENKVDEIGK